MSSINPYQIATNSVNGGKIDRLVENRTVFGGNDTQFCVYDTYARAEAVSLSAANPTICVMVSGKKVINNHLQPAFDFLPGQSLVLPADSDVLIDFPDASPNAPTRCLTIEVAWKKIREIVAKLNDLAPRNV